MTAIGELERELGTEHMAMIASQLWRAYNISKTDLQLWHITETILADSVDQASVKKLQRDGLANEFITIDIGRIAHLKKVATIGFLLQSRSRLGRPRPYPACNAKLSPASCY